jgi:hypothetical protein
MVETRVPGTRTVERPGNQEKAETLYFLLIFKVSLYLTLQTRHVAIVVDLVAIQPYLVVVVAPKHRGGCRCV